MKVLSVKTMNRLQPIGAASKQNINNSTRVRLKGIRTPTVEVVAIDVEYTHVVTQRVKNYSPPPFGTSSHTDNFLERLIPASVCLVNRAGDTLHKGYIALPPHIAASNNAHCVGGVPFKHLCKAPPLRSVRCTLQTLMAGRLVVGHGLAQDLAALGLLAARPAQLMLCTKTCPAFQGRGGTSRSLKVLTQRLLGRTIQAAGHCHDPEEDALAVMELYTKFIEQQRAADRGYEDLVEYHTQRILEQCHRHAALTRLLEQEDCEAGQTADEMASEEQQQQQQLQQGGQFT